MTRIVRLITKELAHRRMNTAMSIIAVAAAVAICVGLAIMHDASIRETRRIQRDIGFNLRIVPRDTDMGRFYLTGYSEHTFSESAVDKLAANETLAYNHIVATLSKQIQVGAGTSATTAIVTGLGEPKYPPGQKRPPMVKPIATGTIHVGWQLARKLAVKTGDTLELGGGSYTIARVSPETGTADDIRIVANLADAQRILAEPGRVNEIKAIDCLCLESSENPQEIIRAEIERVVPDAKVVMLTAIADARARQRQMVERYTAIAAPGVLLVAGLWVALLAMANVRQRAAEVGVLRALGYNSGAVATLFLGKAIAIGVIGALVGYAVGAGAGVWIGPSVFRLTARAIDPQPMLMLYALIAAPLGAAIASFIPAAIAVSQDPAVSLKAD